MFLSSTLRTLCSYEGDGLGLYLVQHERDLEIFYVSCPYSGGLSNCPPSIDVLTLPFDDRASHRIQARRVNLLATIGSRPDPGNPWI
jgi:hypothetical protein